MKIVTVLGARPQFIKASVVSHALTRYPALSEVVVHTGQHFDANMSDVFFSELGMDPPAYQLDVHGGPHGEMTGRMLAGIERVLADERPDIVLVYGDTNSTLAGALAAVKLRIPVAHVEAGLRSFNLAMPEEVNRILTDRISRWLFVPTVAARRHLEREGVDPECVFLVGDVMYDVALHHGARVKAEGDLLGRLGLTPRSYVLATIHRAENTDDDSRLLAIVEALSSLAAELPVVWPVHPRARAALVRIGALDALARAVNLLDPVGYLSMVQLERYAALIATDSGGVQKEAFFYEVPCVTLRDETEWVELVETGWNRLAPPHSGEAVGLAMRAALGSRGEPARPYGEGNAAVRIAEQLAAHAR
ncbi:MAG TPA: UDP-N-acetylglucosamine 2-epimerase (non-hydrolyzing) [Gemmatimonadaceae bacterium]|nr:UDP-N-acetylglucosamine 2-epimerase (non-hydrolyzing) [Gemmatimonadaceae bacterium]